MTPWRWPRPQYPLHEAPELASVDALGIVLQITMAVLRTATPGWERPRRARRTSREAGALRVMHQAAALEAALERYREAADDELRTGEFPVEDDLPF